MAIDSYERLRNFFQFIEEHTNLYRIDHFGYPWYHVAKELFINRLNPQVPGPARIFDAVRRADFLKKAALLDRSYDYLFFIKSSMRTTDPDIVEPVHYLDLFEYLSRRGSTFLILEEPSGGAVDSKYLLSRFAQNTIPYECLFETVKPTQHEIDTATRLFRQAIGQLFQATPFPAEWIEEARDLAAIYLSLEGILQHIVLKQALAVNFQVRAIIGGRGSEFTAGLRNPFGVIQVQHAYKDYGNSEPFPPLPPVQRYQEEHLSLDRFYSLFCMPTRQIPKNDPLCRIENSYHNGMSEFRLYRPDPTNIAEIRDKYRLTGKRVVLIVTSGKQDYQNLYWLIDALIQSSDDIQILIRPHPGYEDIANHRADSIRTFIASSDRKYDLFSVADVILASPGSMVMEASMFTRKIGLFCSPFLPDSPETIAECYPFSTYIPLREHANALALVKELLNQPAEPIVESERVYHFSEYERLFDRIESEIVFAPQTPKPVNRMTEENMVQIVDYVGQLSERDHPFTWNAMDAVFTTSRRYLQSVSERWRHGPDRVLKVSKKVYDQFHAHTSITGKKYLDLGCGHYHPYGTIAFFFINGAGTCYAIDDDHAEPQRAAEALYDELLAALAHPQEWWQEEIDLVDYERRIREFNLAALKDGKPEQGIAAVPIHYQVGDAGYPGRYQSESIDLINSTAVLEHCTDLSQVFATLFKMQPSGGLSYHEIDLVDHRVYSEPERYHYWSFLTCEDDDPHSVSNKLRKSQILELAKSTGYVVLSEESISDSTLPQDLKSKLLPLFQSLSDDDLATTGLKILLQKP